MVSPLQVADNSSTSIPPRSIPPKQNGIRKVLRLIMSTAARRATHRSLALALSLALPACSEPGPAETSQSFSQALPGANPGFGNVAYEELSPLPPGGSLTDLERSLAALQGRGISLGLHWRSDNLQDAHRWQIVAAATARGIEVRPVLTLPEGSEADENPQAPGYATTGYFPNTSNYAAWIASAKQLMSAWTQRGFAPTTLVVDFEMRKRRLHRFAELTGAKSDPLGALVLLSQGIDRQRYARAMAAYRDFAAYAHERGFKLHVTTLLPVLDDYLDGDDALRQAFGIPLGNTPAEVPWDSVSIQVHRTLYRERYAGLTSYFVYDYARAIRKVFGAKAAIDLGLTHGGISTTAPLYANGDELRQDVEAALAAGIAPQNIAVYSWLGMYAPHRAPLSQWLQPPRDVRPPPDDGLSARSHRDWGLLDTLLF